MSINPQNPAGTQPQQTAPSDPNQQSQQPTAFASQLTSSPAPQTTQPTQPLQPQQPTAQIPEQQTQAPKPSLHARIFDKILKGMSGGDIKVVNPDGSVSVQPQSRASMGKSIVAAALTGLMTPTHYRETPYGSVIDYSAGAADAYSRGQQVFAAPQQQAQKLSDEQQARKLMTIQNNSKLLQMQIASSHLNHAMLAEQKGNADTFLQPFEEYDSLRTGDQPKAFLARGLTHDQILTPNSPYKLTDSNVVMDGTASRMNPTTRQFEEEPTYAVLNPDLKEIQLPQEVTDKLAEINSQYKGIHAVTGGNVRIPINAYVSAMHDYQTVTQGEHILNTLNQEINGDDAKEISLSPIVRENRGQMLAALNKMEQSVAGGSTAGNRPDNILDTILKTPNGDKLLGLLGMSPEEADKFIIEKGAERVKANAQAKAAGAIATRKAKPITLSTAPSIANDKTETPERRAQAQAVIASNLDIKAKEEALKAQFAAAKPNPNMMTGSMADGTQVAGTQDELTRAGATGVTKLPAADQSKVSIARQLISPNGLLTNTERDIAAFKPEELTNIGNRWNEFEAGTLGSGDPRYIALRTDARLLSTALMQAHVGSRGSESIMEHFSNLADAGKMDGQTLRAAIGTERRYVTEKAMLPKAQGQQPKTNQPTQTTDPAAAFGGKTRQQ